MKVSYTKALQAPSIILLLLWMIVPLSMTLYFSFMRYNLLYPERTGFTGSLNYDFFLTDPALFDAVLNTLTLVGSIITISVVLGMGIALLLQEAFRGRGIVRVMLISPFFIMPTVNALIWKNMFMNPVYGLFAFVSGLFGWPIIDWPINYWPPKKTTYKSKQPIDRVHKHILPNQSIDSGHDKEG